MGEWIREAYYTDRIVVASGNTNKIAELQTVAAEFGLTLISPSEARPGENLPDIEETGSTYEENASLKARAFASWTGMPALGDDSGLEVAALGGKPGIHSARYAGDSKSDDERIDKLLADFSSVLAGNPQASREARFRCSLVLAYPEGAMICAEGQLEGRLLLERRGSKGFGYDPVVYLYGLGSTLAEIDFTVTCRYGFRAGAARRLFTKLGDLRCR